jgi:hypothetical protein
MDKGLMGTLLRYPYEVRDPAESFDEIQDVKVTKDMLDLARHIVEQKSGRFEPDKFEDQYETALVDLINQKRSGKPITPKDRPRGGNMVDLMDALRKSVGAAAAAPASKKPARKSERRARSEGDADADRRKEAGKGSGEKARRTCPWKVGLISLPFVLQIGGRAEGPGFSSGRRLLWWRFSLLVVATGFAPSAIETPWKQYAMWAQNCSVDPTEAGVRNLLDARSTTMGVVAVAVPMKLNLLALASTGSMLFDCLKGASSIASRE